MAVKQLEGASRSDCLYVHIRIEYSKLVSKPDIIVALYHNCVRGNTYSYGLNTTANYKMIRALLMAFKFFPWLLCAACDNAKRPIIDSKTGLLRSILFVSSCSLLIKITYSSLVEC